MNSGLHWIDGLIIAAYAIGMLALGWHYSRRQSTTDEYFAGGRDGHPLLIGISLFATLLSTISYLSGPGEIIRNGPYMLMGLLAAPVAYVVVGYVIIPVYMRHQVTSAYELLEAKLGLTARLMGATMFILLRVMWMAVLLNFSASAFLVMLDLDQQWLFPVTAAIGGVALFYSTLGGLRAVVVTDSIQFLLLFGGAVIVLISVSVRLGGVGWFPTSWDSGWQPQPIFSLDPHPPVRLRRRCHADIVERLHIRRRPDRDSTIHGNARRSCGPQVVADNFGGRSNGRPAAGARRTRAAGLLS